MEISGDVAGASVRVTLLGGAAALLAVGACISPVGRPTAESGARSGRYVSAGAGTTPARSRLTQARLQETVLPSGMRLLLDEDPFATAIGTVSIVPGGASSDPAGAEGLAHLVEHLVYRAVDPPSPGRPPDEARLNRRERLTRYGMTALNAFTTPDSLIFYELGPPARLEAVLALAGARLCDPLVGVDEEGFGRERRIVGNEYLFREDPRQGGWAAGVLYPSMFPAAHPYARPIAGSDESRRRLTLAAARSWAAATFRPERMTLLVTAPAGVMSLKAIAGKLPPALRGDPAHPVVRPAATPPKPPEGALVGASGTPAASGTAAVVVQRKPAPLPMPELWIGWTLPGAFGGQGPAADLLARWVNEDVGSEQVLQEEPKIRYASASLQPGRHASVLFVRALMAEGADPDRVARVIVARVTSMWARHEAQGETFERLKGIYEAQQALGLPPQLPRAVREAVVAGLEERPRAMREILAEVQAVPNAAVAELAYKNLTRERARAMLFTPAPVAAEAPRPAGVLRAPGDAAGARELLPGAGAWDLKELEELLPAPDAVSIKKMPDGLTVITARRRSASNVAWLAFRGGASDVDPPLLVEMAVRVRPDANQSLRLHILPGRGATRDMSFDSVEFLSGRMGEALALLFAKATAPVREWPSREGIARILAPSLANEDALSRKADREFLRALFGDHPHARIVSPDDVDKLTRSDVDAWLGRVHTVRNAALIVVGDVDPAAVERAAGVLSGQLKSPAWVADVAAVAGPAPRPAKAGGGSSPTVLVTGRPGTLTEIKMGCLLPSMAGADRAHYELLSNAVEARLEAALRTEDGDSYGVQVVYDRLRGGATYLMGVTYVAEETLARSIAAIRANWQRWGTDGFDPGEINVARWRFAGSLAASGGTGHGLAFQIAKAWVSDPEPISRERLYPDVAGARAARTNELFASCKANAVFSLAGNEALVRRALEQAWPGVTARRRAP